MVKERKRKIYSDVTQGDVGLSLWRLSLPSMAGAIFLNLFSLVDLFFIGRLGYVAVAALSISGVILAIIIMVGLGLSTGTTALIAHYIGKKDYDAADNVLFQTILLSVVCSIAMLLLALFATEPILRLFGATKEVIDPASRYLKISFSFSIFIFLFLALNHALRGSGEAIVPLKMLAVANILNIVLDPLFIFGFWIVPKLGVAGSAVATVISRAVGVALLLRHLFAGKSSLHLHRGMFKVNLPIMGRVIRIGFFSSLEVLFRQISLLLLIRLIASFGIVTLAAYGIVLRVRMLIIMLGFGMAGATAVLIGQNMGANLSQRAEESGWKALRYYEAMVLPAALALFLFAPNIVKFFTNHPEVINTAATFIRVTAFTLPFLAMAVILGRGIAGAGDTVAPAWVAGIVQLGVRIPAAYILALTAGLGTIGIWLAFGLSDLLQGAIMVSYFKSGKWQARYHRHREILESDGFILGGGAG